MRGYGDSKILNNRQGWGGWGGGGGGGKNLSINGGLRHNGGRSKNEW